MINIKVYQYNMIKLSKESEKDKTVNNIITNIMLYGMSKNKINQDVIDKYYNESFNVLIEDKHNDLCEHIFDLIICTFLGDDRPNNKLQRSLGTGDIIEINNEVYMLKIVGMDKVDFDLSKIEKHDNFDTYYYNFDNDKITNNKN